jgi:hypothetical protein
MSNALTRPKGQLQASLQIKECDRTVLEFFTDYSFSQQAKTISVKLYGAVEVLDTQRNY